MLKSIATQFFTEINRTIFQPHMKTHTKNRIFKKKKNPELEKNSERYHHH